MLDDDIIAKMNKIEKETEKNNSVTLCVALSYGARQEILAAVKNIARKVKEGELSVDEITMDDISENLYTAGIPDADLLIRTSGELRISNYLLWQSAYTEFYFTDTLWPDFTEQELQEIITSYQKRERRYGKS